MPPKVMDQVVAAGKVLLLPCKQIDALALTALHLHDMSDGVDAPEIGGVDLQGGPSGRLRRGKIIALLIGEAAAGQDGAVAGHVASPFRKDLLDGSKHGLAPAKPKVVEVGEPEGEHVYRMLGDNFIPDRQRAVD